MDSRNFSTISKEECVVAYEALLENSDAKWKAAKVNASLGEYGIASSLCVVSIEELIKAILLCQDSLGFEFRRVKGMDVFFKNHLIRYYIAYWLFTMGWAMNELLGFIKKLRENPEWAISFMEEIKSENIFEQKMKFYLLRQLILLKRELDWFSKIDNIRQDGFYAGYNGKLINPINISQEQYNDVKLKLSIVRKIGRSFITQIANKDKVIIDLIEEKRIEFKSKDHYSKIAIMLKDLRASRNSPFDLFKQVVFTGQ
ncbi:MULTISPECIES: AbiV family abortive infection protein [Niastella]|uniref:AbiV family abortive infection protein n=1 Tax=Niastella soli TaxID=2821487 RepID=A0ABS3Z205_9BACT|nr:AbiV family abortive infection protein [Niastella soli]MBO9204201.1 AbiV family abortive infection protein [Niastella soli]